jgi:ribosomal protein S2
MKPKQSIIPKKVVEEYKVIQDAKKKKEKIILIGGRGYGKKMLHELLTRDN